MVRPPSSLGQCSWDRARQGCICRSSSLLLRALSSLPLYTKSHSAAEPKPTIHQENKTKTFPVPTLGSFRTKISHTNTDINESEQCGVLKAEHGFIYNQVLMGSWINKKFAQYTLVPSTEGAWTKGWVREMPVRAAAPKPSPSKQHASLVKHNQERWK